MREDIANLYQLWYHLTFVVFQVKSCPESIVVLLLWIEN